MSQFQYLHFPNFQFFTGLDKTYGLMIEKVFAACIAKWGQPNPGWPVSRVRINCDQASGRCVADYIKDDRRYIADVAPQFVAAADQASMLGRTAFLSDAVESTSIEVVLKRETTQEHINVPLIALLIESGDYCGRYQVYAHHLLPIAGQSVDPDCVGHDVTYIGVTKRGWRLRWREHCSAAARGSRYRFHEAIRRTNGVCNVVHAIVACGLSEDAANGVEEKFVNELSLYPRGLNMIPGGYAGIEYLRKIGAAGPHERITPDDKHEIINRFFERTSRLGQPNPLTAAMWHDDAYAEKVICGPEDRLKPDQIRTARFLSSLGKDVDEIASEVSARNAAQVRRLLNGDTYSRIN